MKRLEDFTREDLKKFRSEICLNSIYYADYENSFGISRSSASAFFDGYLDYLCDIAGEDGLDSRDEHSWEIILKKYDNIDNLQSWHECYDDFSWVVYADEEDDFPF